MGSLILTMRVAGFILLWLLVLQVQGASISNSSRTTTGPLWAIADGTNQNENQNENYKIFSRLQEYANFCCQRRKKPNGQYYTREECVGTSTKSGMQRGYWAYIPFYVLGTENKLQRLEQIYNPERQTDEEIVKTMCGEPDATIDYPYFGLAPVGTSGDDHVERKLLPALQYAAAQESGAQGGEVHPSDFYLYSYNSPCANRPDDCCLLEIFQATYDSMFSYDANGYFPLHTLRVGFPTWYLFRGAQIPQVRDNFCKVLESYKTRGNFNYVDFYVTLRFEKTFKEDGDENFQSGLPGNYC